MMAAARIEADWVKVVDPTPEEIARIGKGVWSECQRCGGRAGIMLPADLSNVLEVLEVVIDAHSKCLPVERVF